MFTALPEADLIVALETCLQTANYSGFFAQVAKLKEKDAIKAFLKLSAAAQAGVLTLRHEGYTTLHVALKRKFYDFAMLLIDRGADLSIRVERPEKSDNDWSVLALACANGAPNKLLDKVCPLTRTLIGWEFEDLVDRLPATRFERYKDKCFKAAFSASPDPYYLRLLVLKGYTLPLDQVCASAELFIRALSTNEPQFDKSNFISYFQSVNQFYLELTKAEERGGRLYAQIIGLKAEIKVLFKTLLTEMITKDLSQDITAEHHSVFMASALITGEKELIRGLLRHGIIATTEQVKAHIALFSEVSRAAPMPLPATATVYAPGKEKEASVLTDANSAFADL